MAPGMVQLVHTVRVDAANLEDPDALVEALALRGLVVRRLADGDIELHIPGDDGLWNLEVISALEAWLEEADRNEITAELEGSTYTVRAPRPLTTAPHEQTAEAPAARGSSLVDPLVVFGVLGTLLLLAAGIWVLVKAAGLL
jgi:hypothetical protein